MKQKRTNKQIKWLGSKAVWPNRENKSVELFGIFRGLIFNAAIRTLFCYSLLLFLFVRSTCMFVRCCLFLCLCVLFLYRWHFAFSLSLSLLFFSLIGSHSFSMHAYEWEPFFASRHTIVIDLCSRYFLFRSLSVSLFFCLHINWKYTYRSG